MTALTAQERQAILSTLPESVRRAPDITAHLLAHGSLEEGSPTHTALSLVIAQVLINRPTGHEGTGIPFGTLEEFIAWRKLLPGPSVWRLSFLHKRLGQEHFSEALHQLNDALKQNGVMFTPHPERIKKGSWSRGAVQPRARLGSLPWLSWTNELICPDCYFGGGGGRLELFRNRTSGERFFVCEEDDVVVPVVNPWKASYIKTSITERIDWQSNEEDIVPVLYSLFGTDWPHAERVLLQALKDRTELLPAEHRGQATTYTLQTAEPLGPWDSTVWRFHLGSSETVLGAVIPLGQSVPKFVRQHSLWLAERTETQLGPNHPNTS